MASILQLPDDVIAQIAAGEVIERPAYVVKELIDNAIDAQATSIHIETSGELLEKIVVTDNGVGIPVEDLQLASKLHATSKISTSDDLRTVRTLGFRGEALASIAAIGALTIHSRVQDADLGASFSSKNQSVQTAGMPRGTRVVVEQLFEKLPARKTFLKSTQTERRILLDVVNAYTLAYPALHFALTIQGKVMIDRSGESIEERLLSLHESRAIEDFIPLSLEDSYIRLQGYVSKPNFALSSPREQYISINGRPVRDSLISSAIKEAFGTLLPRESHPAAILHIHIPVQLIDVNVHPRKETIAFTSPDHIYLSIQNAVLHELQSHNLTFQLQDWGHSNIPSQSKAGSALKDAVLPQSTTPRYDWTTLNQWHMTYCSVESNRGVIIFDQHAVHERILYEKFMNEYRAQIKKPQVTALAHTLPLKLSSADSMVLEEHISIFEKMGFSFQLDHAQHYHLSGIPSLLSDRDLIPVIEECIHDIREGRPVRTVDVMTKKMITFLACRNAVKAGDVLSHEKMKELIEELDHTPNQFTCPHGRPTKIEMTKNDLDKMFKRV